MSGLNRSSARINYAAIGYLEGLKMAFNSPVNVDEVSVFDHDGHHAVLRSDKDEIGPLALQQGRHWSNVSSGDGGYAACTHYLTTDGERIATVSADVTGDGNGGVAHNHWGVYTNTGIDGSDSQPYRRLNLRGGAENVTVDWDDVDEMRMRPSIKGSSDSPMFLRLESSGNGQHAKTSFMTASDGVKAEVGYDGGKNDMRIVSTTGSGTADVRITDGVIRVASGGPAGSGRVELGFNGAGIEVNGNGEVQVTDEAGNSTVIS